MHKKPIPPDIIELLELVADLTDKNGSVAEMEHLDIVGVWMFDSGYIELISKAADWRYL